MTIEEIFSQLLTHMAKGIIIHNECALLFGFLNLQGYQKCHEYHYYEESYNYKEMQNFFLIHCGKMVKEQSIDKSEIIPSSWYKFNKEDVDANNKRSCVRDLMKKWVDWEKETKKLLESDYKLLYELGEIYAVEKIAESIKDVSEELANARGMYIDLESMGYDIVYMIEQQQKLYKLYHKKIKQIYKDDDK